MTLQPAVMLELWYAATPSDAQKAFAPIFSLKPIYQDSSPTPYNEINTVLDRSQYKDGQKPTWSVALEKLDPAAARELWKHYLAFRLLHPSARTRSSCSNATPSEKSARCRMSAQHSHGEL
jgi:hypothetical protein